MEEPMSKRIKHHDYQEYDDAALLCFFKSLEQGILVVLSGVNKQWRKIALDQTLWTTINITNIHQYNMTVFKKIFFNENGIGALIKRFAKTVEVIISGKDNYGPNCDHGSYNMFNEMSEQHIVLPKLTEISLERSCVNSELIKNFVVNCCPKLIKCNLLAAARVYGGYSYEEENHVDLDSLILGIGDARPNSLLQFSIGVRHINSPPPGFFTKSSIWDNYSSLTSLSIENLQLDGTVLCDSLSKLKQLVYLNMSWMQITGEMRHLDLPVKNLKIMCTNSTKLIQSLINHQLIQLKLYSVKFDVLAYLAKYTPNLEVLQLSDAHSNFEFPNESMLLFTENCPKVYDIHFMCNIYRSEKQLSLFQHLPLLTKLQLELGIAYDDGLWSILKGCKQLQELIISGNGKANNKDAPLFQTYEVETGEFASLRNLIMHSDTPLFSILKGASNITHLTCAAEVKEAPLKLSLPNLTEIYIREQKSEVLIELLRASPRLYTLDLSYWSSLDNLFPTIESIKNHKTLRQLKITSSGVFGDRSIVNYLDKNPNLFSETNIHLTRK